MLDGWRIARLGENVEQVRPTNRRRRRGEPTAPYRSPKSQMKDRRESRWVEKTPHLNPLPGRRLVRLGSPQGARRQKEDTSNTTAGGEASIKSMFLKNEPN